jgi:hypothetical protein
VQDALELWELRGRQGEQSRRRPQAPRRDGLQGPEHQPRHRQVLPRPPVVHVAPAPLEEARDQATPLPRRPTLARHFSLSLGRGRRRLGLSPSPWEEAEVPCAREVGAARDGTSAHG